MICGILHGEGIGAPEDRHGCILPVNHGGQPHEYVAPNGEVIQWETDLDCDCDHCMEAADNGDGDYCTIYWRKERATHEAEALGDKGRSE